MYRENGRGDLRTDEWPWNFADFVRSAVVFTCFFLLYLLGAKSDETDVEIEQLAQAERLRLAQPELEARAYERGRSEGRAERQARCEVQP